MRPWVRHSFSPAYLRLIAAPFYLLDRQVHSRYFRLLLAGAIPGLVLGMLALRGAAKAENSGVVTIILGVLLAVSSSISFFPRVQNPRFAVKNARWLPWLAFPIGVESGFSSAGAGALGTVLLLELFGDGPCASGRYGHLVRACIGGHWKRGALDDGFDQHA